MQTIDEFRQRFRRAGSGLPHLNTVTVKVYNCVLNFVVCCKLALFFAFCRDQCISFLFCGRDASAPVACLLSCSIPHPSMVAQV